MTRSRALAAASLEAAPLVPHAITAASMVDAHRLLGRHLGEAAQRATRLRIAATAPAALAREIAQARATRAHLDAAASRRRTAHLVRETIGEYLACLDAWTEAADLGASLPAAASGELRVDRERVTAGDLALWMQDDNTGCQTGMLRQADGSALLWHTEEDTIGYLDAPRVVSFAVGGERCSAFMYPYLLPGPAFGWRPDQIHAVDSLCIRRPRTAAPGTFTSVASWLVWRLGPAIAAREIIRSLAPFIDGCAINLVQPSPGGAAATRHELGAGFLQTRRLPSRAGASLFQVNIVSTPGTRLGREDALGPRWRARYLGRIQRTGDALARLRRQGEARPEDILRMLADRRGGEYAYANGDVVAHCVARVSAEGIDLHARAGPAGAGDVYRPERSRS